MSAVADKIVKYVHPTYSPVSKVTFGPSFNVHGVVYVGEDGKIVIFSIYLCTSLFLPTEVIAPIEREVRLLGAGLQSVKDEQEYIVVRERVHRNTAESTNSRVKWWSILQAVLLFSVVAWQIYYLKVNSSFVCHERSCSWFFISLSLRSRESSRSFYAILCNLLHLVTERWYTSLLTGEGKKYA